jgi:hypothetical protein
MPIFDIRCQLEHFEYDMNHTIDELNLNPWRLQKSSAISYFHCKCNNLAILKPTLRFILGNHSQT